MALTTTNKILIIIPSILTLEGDAKQNMNSSFEIDSKHLLIHQLPQLAKTEFQFNFER